MRALDHPQFWDPDRTRSATGTEPERLTEGSVVGLRGINPPAMPVEGTECAREGVPLEDPPSTSSQLRSSSDDDSLLNMLPLGLRILLVDPDGKRRSGIRALLEGCQYEVSDLPTCEGALDFLLGKKGKKGKDGKEGKESKDGVGRDKGAEGAAGDGTRGLDAVLIHSGKASSEAGLRLARAIQQSEDAAINGCIVVPYSSDESPATAVQWLYAGAAAYLIEPVRRQELLTIWQHVWRRRTGNQFSGGRSSGSGGTASDEGVRKSAVHKDGIVGADGKPAHRESDGSRSGSYEREGSGQGSGGEGERGAAAAEEVQKRGGSPDGLLTSDNSEGSGVTNKKGPRAHGENINTTGTSNRRGTAVKLEVADHVPAKPQELPEDCLPPRMGLDGDAAAKEISDAKEQALRARNGSAFSAFANHSGSKSSGSSGRRDKGQSTTSVSPTNSRGVRVPPTLLPKPAPMDRFGAPASAGVTVGPAHQGETHGVIANRPSVHPVPGPFQAAPLGMAYGGYPQPMPHPMQLDMPPRHAIDMGGSRAHVQGVPPAYGHHGVAQMHVGMPHPHQYPLPPGSNGVIQVRADWQPPGHFVPGSVSSHAGLKGPQTIHREEALEKFRRKRANRCFDKKIRYASRKRLADGRPRVKGQFVRVSDDAEGEGEEGAGEGDADACQNLADKKVGDGAGGSADGSASGRSGAGV